MEGNTMNIQTIQKTSDTINRANQVQRTIKRIKERNELLGFEASTDSLNKSVCSMLGCKVDEKGRFNFMGVNK